MAIKPNKEEEMDDYEVQTFWNEYRTAERDAREQEIHPDAWEWDILEAKEADNEDQ